MAWYIKYGLILAHIADTMVINKELGVQETGWAVVETELSQEQELRKIELGTERNGYAKCTKM